MQIETLKPALVSKPRPAGEEVTLVVLHATAGPSLIGAIETLRERQLSYHAIIDKDGAITKCCPYSRMALHAGSSYGPKEAAAKVSREQNHHTWQFVAGCSVNRYSIGISFVNWDDGRDPVTDAQTSAAEELITALRRQFSGLTDLTSHALVSPHRKVDPLGYDLAPLAERTGLNLWRP